MVVLRSVSSLIFSLIVLSIFERGVEISNYNYFLLSVVRFCLLYFAALLFGVYTPGVVLVNKVFITECPALSLEFI